MAHIVPRPLCPTSNSLVVLLAWVRCLQLENGAIGPFQRLAHPYPQRSLHLLAEFEGQLGVAAGGVGLGIPDGPQRLRREEPGFAGREVRPEDVDAFNRRDVGGPSLAPRALLKGLRLLVGGPVECSLCIRRCRPRAPGPRPLCRVATRKQTVRLRPKSPMPSRHIGLLHRGRVSGKRTLRSRHELVLSGRPQPLAECQDDILSRVLGVPNQVGRVPW